MPHNVLSFFLILFSCFNVYILSLLKKKGSLILDQNTLKRDKVANEPSEFMLVRQNNVRETLMN